MSRALGRLPQLLWVLLPLLVARPQPVAGAVVMQIGQNFTGATLGVDSLALPPDPNGAVGPNHFVEFINGRVSIYDKTSGARLATMTDLDFWIKAGVSMPSNLDVTDPRLIFDPASQRWFVSEVDVDANNSVSNRFLLAVSASANPTGAWHGFAFLADPVTAYFADFPTLGLDGAGVYLSGDLFDINGNSIGPTLVAIPKSQLLSSSPTVAGRTSFGALNYATDGAILQPAVCQGPASSSGAVLAMGDLGFDMNPHSTLVNTTIANPGSPGQATLLPPATISVPPYVIPLDPTQPNGRSNLDDGDARLSAMVYRVGDVLYGVHSLEIDNRAAIQWFEVNATNHTLIQSGTIKDSNLELFYPSIAANADGVVVVACNGCSLTTYVGCYAAVGETVNGTLSFGGLQLLKAGVANYQNRDATGTSRWGDYSTTSVDPTDPYRFWTIQMYAAGSSTWATQISELILSPVTVGIELVGSDVVITWPSAATGFQLQWAPTLGPTATWSPVSQTPTTSGNQLSLTIPASDQQAYFRLAHP